MPGVRLGMNEYYLELINSEMLKCPHLNTLRVAWENSGSVPLSVQKKNTHTCVFADQFSNTSVYSELRGC